MQPDDRLEELDRLLLEQREGSLSAEGRERLRCLLRESSEARSHFARSQMLDPILRHEQASGSETTDRVPGLAAKPIGRQSPEDCAEPGQARPWTRIACWVAAASLLFAMGVAAERWMKRRSPSAPMAAKTDAAIAERNRESWPDTSAEAAGNSPLSSERSDDGVAIITGAVDATWAGEVRPALGSSLSPGRLQLSSGLVQVEFYGGAKVILEGPADCEMASIGKIVCRRGKVRVQVPPQAQGFTVVSPAGELIDLGTEFGVEVSPVGLTDVHVFKGEVELRGADASTKPGEPRKLTEGKALRFNIHQAAAPIELDARAFVSMDEFKRQSAGVQVQRYQAWRQRMVRTSEDRRLLACYNFEPTDELPQALRSHDPTVRRLDGAIVGCLWAQGRWPGKGALEFTHPGDRVRITVPGKCDALTLAAWVRVDGLGNAYHGLLLTDGFEIGRPHWQIRGDGSLRLGIRHPSDGEKVLATGYSSPPIFSPNRMGVWCFLASVYDTRTHSVVHYLNGQEIARHRLQVDQPLEIGTADIGNWGVPLSRTRHPVRNFIGRIDEFSIWSVALAASDIQQMYEVGRP